MQSMLLQYCTAPGDIELGLWVDKPVWDWSVTDQSQTGLSTVALSNPTCNCGVQVERGSRYAVIARLAVRQPQICANLL